MSLQRWDNYPAFESRSRKFNRPILIYYNQTWHRGLGELKQIKRGLAMNNTFLTFIPPSLGAKYEF